MAIVIIDINPRPARCRVIKTALKCILNKLFSRPTYFFGNYDNTTSKNLSNHRLNTELNYRIV